MCPYLSLCTEDSAGYWLSVADGAGLRATEVISLKVSDIDSKHMNIRVEQGKGRNDRNVMRSPSLLDLLRTWWRAARPQGWLFPGRDPTQRMNTRQLNRATTPRPRWRRSKSASRCTRCRTALPPTCSSRTLMYAWRQPRSMAGQTQIRLKQVPESLPLSWREQHRSIT